MLTCRSRAWIAVAALFLAASTAMAATNDALSAADQKFVERVIQANLYQAQVAQVALKKSSNSDVKQLAQTLANNSATVKDKFSALASDKNITAPKTVNSEQLRTINSLTAQTGRSFNLSYAQTVVRDRMNDVSDFEMAARRAQDPDLLALVKQTLPLLQNDLKLAQTTTKAVVTAK